MNIRNYHHVSPLILLALQVICNSGQCGLAISFCSYIDACYICTGVFKSLKLSLCGPALQLDINTVFVCTYTKDMNKAVCYNMDSFIYFLLVCYVSNN